MISQHRFAFTTDASENASETTVPLNGLFRGFAVKLGDSSAIDVTIDNADGINLFTKTGLTTGFFLSRLKTVSELNVDITYDGTRKVFDMIPVVGELTITIANGGVTKTAAVIIYIER